MQMEADVSRNSCVAAGGRLRWLVENVDFISYVKSAVPLHTHTESIDFGSRTTTVRASVHANQWTASERSACPSRGSAARPRARALRGPFRRRIFDCVAESVNKNRLTLTIFTQISDAGWSVLFITI